MLAIRYPYFCRYAPAPPPDFVRKKYGSTFVRKHLCNRYSDKGRGEIWNNFRAIMTMPFCRSQQSGIN